MKRWWWHGWPRWERSFCRRMMRSEAGVESFSDAASPVGTTGFRHLPRRYSDHCSLKNANKCAAIFRIVFYGKSHDAEINVLAYVKRGRNTSIVFFKNRWTFRYGRARSRGYKNSMWGPAVGSRRKGGGIHLSGWIRNHHSFPGTTPSWATLPKAATRLGSKVRSPDIRWPWLGRNSQVAGMITEYFVYYNFYGDVFVSLSF